MPLDLQTGETPQPTSQAVGVSGHTPETNSDECLNEGGLVDIAMGGAATNTGTVQEFEAETAVDIGTGSSRRALEEDNHTHHNEERSRDVDTNHDLDAVLVRLTLEPHSENSKPVGTPTPDSEANALALLKLGILLHLRFIDREIFEDLNRAIVCLTQAALEIPDGHADQPSILHKLGVSYLTRFEHHNQVSDVNKAIDHLVLAVSATPDEDIDKSIFLSGLADAYIGHFQCVGESISLNKAIDCLVQAKILETEYYGNPDLDILKGLWKACWYRYECTGDLANSYTDKTFEHLVHVVSLLPDDDSDKFEILRDLGVLYLRRFDHSDDLSNLNAAINHLSKARSIILNSDPDAFEILNNLGSSYQRRFKRLGDIADIDSAIDCYGHAVLLVSDDHKDKPRMLQNLALSYRYRFDRQYTISDIDESIRCLMHAASLLEDIDPDLELRGKIHAKLGNSYLRRYNYLHEFLDVEKAVGYLVQALSLISDDDHLYKPAVLNSLGTSYSFYFDHRADASDLDKSIQYLEEANSLALDHHKDKPEILYRLGISYQDRFKHSGNHPDIDKAIDSLERAISLKPDSEYFQKLARAYTSRFECLENLPDADRAIECRTKGISLAPADHEELPAWLNNLGLLHFKRFERFNQPTDIDETIRYLTRSILLTPDGHKDKPARLFSLGNSYGSRFDHLGQSIDIEKAIDYSAQAAALIPGDHETMPRVLNTLGILRLYRFERQGQLSDINEAIDCMFRSASLIPDGSLYKAEYLSALGISYHSRFRLLGEVPDIDQSIASFNQALLFTKDPTQLSKLLSNLGASYLSRFESMREISDVNKAIDILAQAAETCHIYNALAIKSKILGGLGNAYRRRFEVPNDSDPADINKAIEVLGQAISLVPDNSSDNLKPGWVNDLGSSYLWRFKRVGEISDLNAAIECHAKAVSLTPESHADKSRRLCNLGVSYEQRFERLGNRQDIEDAVMCIRDASLCSPGHPYNKFQASRVWGSLAFSHNVSDPLIAYQNTMELVPQLVWLGTTIERRYRVIEEMGDVATEAASRAISLKDYDHALEWLEQGRSIVWNQILQLRTPFDDLSAKDPELASELKEVGRRLEYAGSRSNAVSMSPSPRVEGSLQQEAKHHHNLASDWDRLLNQARQIPGFENFMRPRRASELKSAAKDGPVVVINVHKSRCDALIVLPGGTKISHVPLENFSMDKAVNARTNLGAFIGHRGGTQFQSSNLKRSVGVWKRSLKVLWLDVVKPVLDFLGYTDKGPVEKQPPRVTWCTTGPLSFLPLHAAGCYDSKQPNIFDLVVSSYTPTLGALLTSPASTGGVNAHSGVLAVAQPETSGLRSLPFTIDELAAIEEHASAVDYFPLVGAQATVDRVLEAMGKHDWVHLACHAIQKAEDPVQSAFYLHDGSLLLSKIAEKSFHNKGLAFLSACQTATGDKKMPDEAVHLAAGMLMAGYRSVIATMWSIYDKDGPVVARRVYADLLKDGKMDCSGAARALHSAIEDLRGQVGETAFQRWVPFIHIGC